MRSSLLLFFLAIPACGGAASSSIPDGERTPAAPFPDQRTPAAETGPTGFVTMLSIDDQFIASARFVENAARGASASGGGSGCSASRGTGRALPEVSAGKIAIQVPTRSGEQSLDLLFDPAMREYELGYLDARAEPGAVLRIAADGDRVPAFDAEIRWNANVVFDVPEVLELDARAPSDVALRWTAEGDSDELFVSLSVGETSVTCFFAPEARGGAIPASLVVKLLETAPPECTRATCLLYLASKRARSVAAGEWTVLLAHGIGTIREVRVTR